MKKQKKQFLGMLLILAVLAAAYGGIHVYNQKQEEKRRARRQRSLPSPILKPMM